MRALFALLVVGLLPGLLVTGATHPAPDSLRTSERLLLSIVASLAVALIGGLALVGLDALAPLPIALWIAIACGLAFAAARGRGCRFGSIAARAADDLRQPAGALGLGIVVAYGLVFWLRQGLDPWSSPHPTWNYLGDMLAMLDARGIPAYTLDYGVPFHFETNKIAWYLAATQWLALSGTQNALWSAVHTLVPAVASAVALAVWVFARSLFTSTGYAALASVSILALPRVVAKLAGVRGESLAWIVLFALAWLVLRTLRGRDPLAAWLAGVCAAVLALVHLVPAAVAALWGASFALAFALLEGRSAARGLARLAASAGIAALIVLAVWSVVPRSPLDSQAAIGEPGALGPYRGRDPAHAYLQLVYTGEVGPRTAPYRDPASSVFYFHPLYVLRELVERSALPHPLWPEGHPWWLAGIAAGIVALAWRAPPLARAHALAVPLLFASLYALGVAFSHRYHTFLPAQHPQRREFMYLQLFFVLALVAGLEAAVRRLSDRLGTRPAQAAALGLAALLVLPVAAAGFAELRAPRALARSSVDGRAALEWLRTRSDPDARILLDGSAVGLLGALTRRVCVSEGRAPYFQPANLRVALDTLSDARAFFRSPEAASDFLAAHAIDTIVTGSRELGARPFAETPLRLDPGLFPVAARFGEVVIHRVPGAREPGRGSSGDVTRE